MGEKSSQAASSVPWRSFCIVSGLVCLVGMICWFHTSKPLNVTDNSVHYGKVLPVSHAKVTFKPPTVMESAYLQQRDGGLHYSIPQKPSTDAGPVQEVNLYRAFTQIAGQQLVVLKQLVQNGVEVQTGDALLLVKQAGQTVTMQASSDGVVYFPKEVTPGKQVEMGSTIAVIGHPQAVGSLLAVGLPLSLLAVITVCGLWVLKARKRNTEQDADEDETELEASLQQPSSLSQVSNQQGMPSNMAPPGLGAVRTALPVSAPTAYLPVPHSTQAPVRTVDADSCFIDFKKREESGKSEVSTKAPSEA
eukprot:TRINITY_DN17624_c0_g2_i1.p1 TRINITY_DN17624_c0_g2~~TRINITY_DN17624_c0_g2_i1.p1  ORF type:complete len:305 (+),score=64.10 TRINITY_DN17624_c0_g2_i1:67-981(+)